MSDEKISWGDDELENNDTSASQVSAQEQSGEEDIFDTWDMPEGYQYHNPFTETKLNKGEVPLALPTTILTSKDIEKITTNLYETGKRTLEEIRDIASSLNELRMGHKNPAYSSMTERENFAQYISHEGKELRNTNSVYKLKAGTSHLSGPQAGARVREKTGAGREVIWRLWESGLIVKIGNFPPNDIFKQQMRLANTYAEIGRDTRGAMLSYDDVHIVTSICDWIIDHHILECNVRGWTPEFIKENLNIFDCDTLMLGALQAIYPKGYPFVRDCSFKGTHGNCDWSTLKHINDIDHLVRMDFRKITHTETSSFTPFQKKIMSMGWNSISKEDIAKYREQSEDRVYTTPRINANGDAIYRLNIRPAMYADYREEGLTWINNLSRLIDESLEYAPEVDADMAMVRRRDAIESYQEKIKAQKETPWIRDIVEKSTEGELTYGGDSPEGRIQVMETLGDLSSDGETAEMIVNEVQKYKNKYSRTFVAFPNFECPACKEGQDDILPLRPYLIPMSVVHYFFGIMVLTLDPRG